MLLAIVSLNIFEQVRAQIIASSEVKVLVDDTIKILNDCYNSIRSESVETCYSQQR
jgi:hypothetical protein